MRVLALTDNDHSSAQDIGDVIMRDQPLTAKILKLANSPAYSTRSAVTTPTQAVIIVGMEVIRSITVAAELIEQTEAQHGNTVNLKRLLARSLVAASQSMELGIAVKHKDPGMLFTSAMLYSLGDLVIAYCLPDVYRQFDQDRSTHPEQVRELEKQYFGRPLTSVAASIAKQWHLPASFVQLMEAPRHIVSAPPQRPQEQMECLVRLSNELSCILLDPPTPSLGARLDRLLKQLSTAFRLSPQHLEAVAIRACKKALQFCDAVNIEKEFFIPTAPPASPTIHPFYRTITGTLTADDSTSTPPPSTQTSSTIPPLESHSIPKASQGSSLWTFLETFTLRALTVSDPNILLNLAAEGLHSAGGFDRVILALLVPGTKALETRISFGVPPAILNLFQCANENPVARIAPLHQSGPLQLPSLQDERIAGHFVPEFVKQWGNHPCVVGALVAKEKPIGLILADRGPSGQPLSQGDFAGFVMILSQTNGTLTRLAH